MCEIVTIKTALNVSWKIWRCQALREAGRAGRSRPAFAVGVLLCVGGLCAPVLDLGRPALHLGFRCELETTWLSLPALVLHCQPLQAAMRISPQLAAFLQAKLFLGRATECMLPFVVGCWEGKLDFLYRDLLTSSKQQIVASGAQSETFFFKSNTCFYYPNVLEEGTTTKITPKQSCFGCSSN